jgi:hypothetical protein
LRCPYPRQAAAGTTTRLQTRTAFTRFRRPQVGPPTRSKRRVATATVASRRRPRRRSTAAIIRKNEERPLLPRQSLARLPYPSHLHLQTTRRKPPICLYPRHAWFDRTRVVIWRWVPVRPIRTAFFFSCTRTPWPWRCMWPSAARMESNILNIHWIYIKNYKHFRYKTSAIRLAIEYVFIINLFTDINADTLCYKLTQIWSQLMG